MDRPVHIADHRPPEAHLLDRPADAGDGDDVAHAVRVLAEDQHAVEVVTHQLLGSEPDRPADRDAEPDAEAANRIPGRGQEGRHDDARDDRDREPADQAQAEGGHRVQAPAPLRAADRLLIGGEVAVPGRRRGGGPGHEAPHDAGQHAVGEPRDRHHDQDDQRVARGDGEEVAQPVGEVLHRG